MDRFCECLRAVFTCLNQARAGQWFGRAGQERKAGPRLSRCGARRMARVDCAAQQENICVCSHALSMHFHDAGPISMLSLTKPIRPKIPSVPSKTYSSGAQASIESCVQTSRKAVRKRKTSIRIPDIASVGLAWPRGCPLCWWVRCRFRTISKSVIIPPRR